MRRFFLFLMIALLPLRSWAGDIMAVDMTMQHLVAINYIANNAYATRASDTLDTNQATDPSSECPGHAAMVPGIVPGAVNTTNTPTDDHCSTCGVCQICHTVALAQVTVGLASAFIAASLVPLVGTRFTSALPALGLKPPIS